MSHVHSAVESNPHRPQGIPDWVFRVVLHLNELEKKRGAQHGNWAGFVTETVLPRLGIDRRHGAQQIEWLEHEGYVTVSQVPNPKVPARTASFIKLNQRHPKVHEVLEYARSLKAGFLPVEVAGAGIPGHLVTAEREERGGGWDLLLPRVSRVRSPRALVWNAAFFQGGSHLALDLQDGALHKRVEDAFTGPRALALRAPERAPAQPGSKSWYFGRPGEPWVDVSLYEEGIVQCDWDLAFANDRAHSEASGHAWGLDRGKEVVCGETIRMLTQRVWRMIREIPVSGSSGIDDRLRVRLFFTVRGMRGTVYVDEASAIDFEPRGQIAESDCRLLIVDDALRLDLPDLPDEPVEACLDRIAEHYGRWSHAQPAPRLA